MRRIISILTVALIMALMAVAMAVPAFAQGSQCGEEVSGLAPVERQIFGSTASRFAQELGPEFGQGISECSPTR